jgi:hypothetical protein
MAELMFQFKHPSANPPTIEEVRREWHLGADDLNANYGVVPIDPRAGLYVVLVRPEAVPRLERELQSRGIRNDPAVGVFANPRVEPNKPP